MKARLGERQEKLHSRAATVRKRISGERSLTVAARQEIHLLPLALPVCRRAFSLLEMLVVMMFLGVFMALFVVVVWGVLRVQRADAEVFNRMMAHSALADQFRADVGRAWGPLAGLRGRATGPQCLILQLAQEQQVIYAWEEGRLRRIEIHKDGASEQILSVGGANVSVEFFRSGPRGDLVTLRIAGEQGQDNSRRPLHLDISAALGGDWR